MLHIILSEILNIVNLVTSSLADNRKWIKLFYGNRIGYLPYESEEELKKILDFHKKWFE